MSSASLAKLFFLVLGASAAASFLFTAIRVHPCPDNGNHTTGVACSSHHLNCKASWTFCAIVRSAALPWTCQGAQHIWGQQAWPPSVLSSHAFTKPPAATL